MDEDSNEDRDVTIREALDNALTFLESLGYKGGDIHDDLKLAINRLIRIAPKAMATEL